MNYFKSYHLLHNQDLKEALKHTIPIMAGYLFLGFAFGLLMSAGGYPLWVPVMMSLFVYSGALEFAAIPFFASAFDPLGAFVLGLMLSARHLFYGIPLLKRYSKTGRAKPFRIFGLTDEIFSLLVAPEKGTPKSKSYYVFVTLLGYLYWNIGTVMGALSGEVITADLSGLDFALTALFLVLFLEQTKSTEGKRSGVVGIIASALALFCFGKESMVIMAMGFILITLLAGRRVFANE